MATLWSRAEDGARYEFTSRTRQSGRYDGDSPTERLRGTGIGGVGQNLVERVHERSSSQSGDGKAAHAEGRLFSQARQDLVVSPRRHPTNIPEE